MKGRELLFSLIPKRDLVFESYKASGPGGQHRNKTMSAIRLKHPASGVTVIAADERSQSRNKRIALRRLADHPQFKRWVRRQVSVLMEGYQSIEEKVEEMMRPENLKIEYYTPKE